MIPTQFPLPMSCHQTRGEGVRRGRSSGLLLKPKLLRNPAISGVLASTRVLNFFAPIDSKYSVSAENRILWSHQRLAVLVDGARDDPHDLVKLILVDQAMPCRNATSSSVRLGNPLRRLTAMRTKPGGECAVKSTADRSIIERRIAH